jgi:hypothetical protein
MMTLAHATGAATMLILSWYGLRMLRGNTGHDRTIGALLLLMSGNVLLILVSLSILAEVKG